MPSKVDFHAKKNFTVNTALYARWRDSMREHVAKQPGDGPTRQHNVRLLRWLEALAEKK